MQTAYWYIFEWIQYTGVHAHSWHGKALILFYISVYNRQTLLHQLNRYLFTYSSLWDNTIIQFDDVQILWIPMWTFVMHMYTCESANLSCMLTLYQESGKPSEINHTTVERKCPNYFIHTSSYVKKSISITWVPPEFAAMLTIQLSPYWNGVWIYKLYSTW